VIQVLLTHHHPDHALGNQAFKDVPIGALAGTTRLLHEQGDGMAENLYRMVGDWMRGTEVQLPTQVLEPGVLSFGRHDLTPARADRPHRRRPGHPRPDYRRAVCRRPGVLPTRPHHPQHARAGAWLADIDTLQALPWTLVVPGHGPVANDAQPFAQMRDYLTWLDQLLRDGAAHGSDMAEMIRSPIPERFAAINLSRYELIRSVSHLYPRYEREQMQRVDSAR